MGEVFLQLLETWLPGWILLVSPASRTLPGSRGPLLGPPPTLLVAHPPAGGGVGAGGIVLIVLGCVGLLGGAGYFAYQYRLRGLMQQEVRAIMSQYMVRRLLCALCALWRGPEGGREGHGREEGADVWSSAKRLLSRQPAGCS